MDFTPELSAFQGVILSADNVHNFSRLSCRGGNEDNIKNVIELLLRFLKNEKYIDDNGIIDPMVSKMRKFAMYIVLNTDITVLEDMVDLEGIFIVIWSIPTLPKHLMCELLWNLHMEQFAWEIITYCYPPLALEVAGAFVENLKYMNPTECLHKLHKLSAATYLLICRLDCFVFETDKLNSILTTGFETLQKCLKYFSNPPNSHKLNVLSKDQLYKYKGGCFKTMLRLIYECLTYFTQDVNSSYLNDIYKATYLEECFKNNPPTNKVCESSDKTLLECLNNSNILLLDIFKEIVMDISVDIFCAWSEFGEGDKSMQQSIGELCHKVRSQLLHVESVAEHPVVGMIQQMARTPVIIEDIINSIDTNVIIQKINSNDEDKPLWLHALVNKEQLCQHSDLITIIGANLDIYDKNECLKLYHMFTNYHKSNSNNSELVRTLAIKVFQYCDVPDKQRILQEHFNDNQFQDMSNDEDFHNVVIEMFNKFIASSDVDLTEVLNVFLQNPRQVYNKIFRLAKENTQLTSTMLKVMELLKDYSDYYYVTETEPCIINVTKSILEDNLETEAVRESIVRFLHGLKNSEIIPGTKLLLLIIMPNMHKALLSKDIAKIHVQIQLLVEAYTVNELLKYRAPMLAMLSQVLEVVRWQNIREFVPNAPSTLQLTLNFQKSLIVTYDNVIPDSEGNWLRIRLKQIHMQPQNNYYFRQLWSNSENTNYFQSVSGVIVNKDTSRSEISIWVTQMLSSGTLEEWCTIWDDLLIHIEDIDMLCIYHEAFRTITKAVEGSRSPATRACLLYCFQNLVYIIRYKFVREPLTDRQVISIAFSLSKVLKDTNNDDVDEIGSRVMPLFAYLVENKTKYTTNVAKYFENTNYYTVVCKAFNCIDTGHVDVNT